MSTILPYLLNWLREFGYPVLWLTVFIAAVGVPLPITLLLLAAGAFSALGDFNLLLLVVIAWTASSCGDSVGYWIGYWIGRCWGSKVLNWTEHSKWRRLFPPSKIKQSQQYFNQRGAWAIFLSRFLFSSLGGVINLVAGSDSYSYHRFLVYDIVGELLGAAIPLTVGYEGWKTLGNILVSLSGYSIGLCAVILISIQFVRRLRRPKDPIVSVHEPPDS
jgi:membrane-associated protein